MLDGLEMCFWGLRESSPGPRGSERTSAGTRMTDGTGFTAGDRGNICSHVEDASPEVVIVVAVPSLPPAW